jgi:hypothetical protein
LQQRIVREFGIPCYAPANGEILTIAPSTSINKFSNAIPVDISRQLLNKQYYDKFFFEAQHNETEFEDLFFEKAEGKNICFLFLDSITVVSFHTH